MTLSSVWRTTRSHTSWHPAPQGILVSVFILASWWFVTPDIMASTQTSFVFLLFRDAGLWSPEQKSVSKHKVSSKITCCGWDDHSDTAAHTLIQRLHGKYGFFPLQSQLSEFCCLSVALDGQMMASIWLWAWWAVWWASGTRTERRKWRSSGRVAHHHRSGLSPGTRPSKREGSGVFTLRLMLLSQSLLGNP